MLLGVAEGVFDGMDIASGGLSVLVVGIIEASFVITCTVSVVVSVVVKLDIEIVSVELVATSKLTAGGVVFS